MNKISKQLSGLDVNQYYEKHLHIINEFLPIQLTKTEIKVLSSFMSLKGDLIEQDRFGTQARKIVREKLNMSSGGLGNHLKSLRESNSIKLENKKYVINRYLIPDEQEQGYQFKISRA